MEKEKNKRVSKRLYKEIACANPECDYGHYFTPHHRKQRFCCEQCKTNYYNDKRSNDNKRIYFNEKKLRLNDIKLARIYKKFVDKDGYCQVHREVIYYESIDVMLIIEELKNRETGGKVKRYYRYGIEIHPHDPNYYIIHKIEKL